MAKKKYKEWTLIQWDSNLDLGLQCWRKSFRNGHVSVGVGEYVTIVHSYGPNSDYSGSGTRWDYDRPTISEEETMTFVDKCRGHFSFDALRLGYITKEESETRKVIEGK